MVFKHDSFVILNCSLCLLKYPTYLVVLYLFLTLLYVQSGNVRHLGVYIDWYIIWMIPCLSLTKQMSL